MGGGLYIVIVNERLKMRKSVPSQLITDRIPSLVPRSSKIEFSKNLGGRAAAPLPPPPAIGFYRLVPNNQI